jgi:hypothetical protein
MEDAIRLMFAGLSLLFIHSVCTFIFPTTVPLHWRHYEIDTVSKRFLQLIQRYDNGRSCFPSMHCALATFACLVLYQTLGIWAFLFLVLIAVSCLLVKQHQMLDIPPGFLLGWLAHQVFATA